MIRVAFLILLLLAALPCPVLGQTGSFYAIQADTFNDAQKAAKKTELLKKKGLDASYRESRPAGKPKRYIVYIGNYESKDEARNEARRLKQQGLLADFTIVSVKAPDRPKPSQEQPLPKETEPGLVISEITFKPKSPGKETVLIQGSGPFAPTAFAIEEDKPRFVIDIKNTEPVKRELSQIATDGQLIERVRTFYHKGNRTLRVVLDLQPSKTYRISQFFYQAQNVYAVEVEAE